MESQLEAMIGELGREGAKLRTVLERLPAGQLEWRPHPKSMTLGQLALHVATLPAAISHMASLDGFDAAHANFESAQPASKDEVLAALDGSLSSAAAYLKSITPEAGSAAWKLTLNGAEIFAMPRVMLLRDFLMNHWHHHRGQLTVYLRLLDVPVPVLYGRSADENPFA